MPRVPVRYRDRTGSLDAELETDGRRLELTVARVVFEGQDLDSLDPRDALALPARFTLAGTGLSACELAFALPITVLTPEGERSASLAVELRLGKPSTRGGLEDEHLRLELVVGERRARSSGKSGWFEDELTELQRACPDLHLKTCFGCAHSDYSPYGHGSFGSLLCFRDEKEAYRKVSSKQGLFEIHDSFTEQVQETHVCTEFERRSPGTGYRG